MHTRAGVLASIDRESDVRVCVYVCVCNARD